MDNVIGEGWVRQETHPLLLLLVTSVGRSAAGTTVPALAQCSSVLLSRSLFSLPFSSVSLSYFILASSYAQVLGTTFVHEFNLFNRLTEWNLLLSLCGNSEKFWKWSAVKLNSKLILYPISYVTQHNSNILRKSHFSRFIPYVFSCLVYILMVLSEESVQLMVSYSTCSGTTWRLSVSSGHSTRAGCTAAQRPPNSTCDR